MKLFTRFAICALAVLAACGDDPTAVAERCGDGVCSARENELICPRDCPYLCVPNTARCLGNVLMVCRIDGRGEVSEPCAPGEYCTATGCEASPGAPDIGTDGPDMGDDASDQSDSDDLDVGDETDL